jgi:hypothetical protein
LSFLINVNISLFPPWSLCGTRRLEDGEKIYTTMGKMRERREKGDERDRSG